MESGQDAGNQRAGAAPLKGNKVLLRQQRTLPKRNYVIPERIACAILPCVEEKVMYYSEVKECDIANGPGVRVTLFVSGCTHHCKGCFNEMTWDFQYGREFTEEDIDKLIKLLEPSYVAGLTLLGGEPMEYRNQQGLLLLLRKVKEAYPDKTIWCYTGYLYEKDILENFCGKWEETREMLSYLDVIVDGEFVEELKDISLRFRGSSNQRIIDVKKSRETGKVVLWED